MVCKLYLLVDKFNLLYVKLCIVYFCKFGEIYIKVFFIIILFIFKILVVINSLKIVKKLNIGYWIDIYIYV